MKNLKSFILKYASSLAAFALTIGVTASEQACWFLFNQPEEPKGLAKFRKDNS